MIDIDVLYELYVKVIKDKINKIEKHNEAYLENINILKNNLNKFETEIKTYCRIELKDIYTFTNINDIKKVYFPAYTTYKDGAPINFKAIKLYITKYIDYNKIIESNKKLVLKYKKEIIKKRVYVAIIKKFNMKVIKKIVEHNLFFNTNTLFGSIAIYKVVNTKKIIDWGKSTKNKQKLLAEGKIPYLKADAERIENYQGVKWIEHRNPVDYAIFWIKHKYMPYLKDYSFSPARGRTAKAVSFVGLLGDFKANREQAENTYTRLYERN